MISLVGFQKSLSERKQNNTQGRHHYSLYAAPRTPSSPGRFAGLARGGDSLSCVKCHPVAVRASPVPVSCHVCKNLLVIAKKDRQKTDDPRRDERTARRHHTAHRSHRDFKERSVVLAVAHPWASASLSSYLSPFAVPRRFSLQATFMPPRGRPTLVVLSPACLSLHPLSVSSLCCERKKERKRKPKERKRTTQGRDGRTARRLETQGARAPRNFFVSNASARRGA